MSFKQYRTLDLCIWCLLYIVFEYITVKAATVWFDEPYSISLMLPLLLIVMMRWDKYSIFQAVLSAILFTVDMKGSFTQMLIYLVGNLGFMLNLFYLKKFTKEKVADSLLLSELYVICGFILMEVFRGLASIVIVGSPLGVIKEFILTDMLTLVFSMVVIFLVRRINDLFVDQKAYLLKLKQQNSSNEMEERDYER